MPSRRAASSTGSSRRSSTGCADRGGSAGWRGDDVGRADGSVQRAVVCVVGAHVAHLPVSPADRWSSDSRLSGHRDRDPCRDPCRLGRRLLGKAFGKGRRQAGWTRGPHQGAGRGLNLLEEGQMTAYPLLSVVRPRPSTLAAVIRSTSGGSACSCVVVNGSMPADLDRWCVATRTCVCRCGSVRS